MLCGTLDAKGGVGKEIYIKVVACHWILKVTVLVLFKYKLLVVTHKGKNGLFCKNTDTNFFIKCIRIKKYIIIGFVVVINTDTEVVKRQC